MYFSLTLDSKYYCRTCTLQFPFESKYKRHLASSKHKQLVEITSSSVEPEVEEANIYDLVLDCTSEVLYVYIMYIHVQCI